MTKESVNRIWIVGDIHFGVRANLLEWQNITKQYFEEYLIPLLKREAKPGDIMIQVGDVFENRQILNLRVQHLAMKSFKEIGEIMPTYIICGNHDIYFKSTNDVTSLDTLSGIPGITILKEPELFNFNGKDCLLMPWRRDAAHELETIAEYTNNGEKQIDFLFCHSEVMNAKLNKKSINFHGNRVSKFKNFRRVYSGHIHYSQIIKNVHFVGNAYQMTRSDSSNAKGAFLLDLNTDEHEFFPNDVTPKFLKLDLAKMYDLTLAEFKSMIKGNFVDLYIPENVMIKYNIQNLLGNISGIAREVTPYQYSNQDIIDAEDLTNVSDEYKELNIQTLCEKAVANSHYDEDLKERLKAELTRIYTICTSSYDPDNDVEENNEA